MIGGRAAPRTNNKQTVTTTGLRRPTLTEVMEFLRDLWDFLRVRKKLWLLPIVLIMLLLGGLVMVSQQSVLGSFIYTLF